MEEERWKRKRAEELEAEADRPVGARNRGAGMGEDGEVTLAVIRSDIGHLTKAVDKGFKGVEEKLKELNGTVRQHETRMTLLERFCDERVKPALAQVMENRIELARVIAKWGSLGVGGGGAAGFVIYMIGKGQGAW